MLLKIGMLKILRLFFYTNVLYMCYKHIGKFYKIRTTPFFKI